MEVILERPLADEDITIQAAAHHQHMLEQARKEKLKEKARGHFYPTDHNDRIEYMNEQLMFRETYTF